jgi:PAS domain S-box-containing protein
MGNKPTYNELERLLEERTDELKNANEFLTEILAEYSHRKKLMLIQHNLSISLSTTYDLIEGLRLGLKTGIKVSGMDCGGIYLFDKANGDLNLIVHQGLTDEFVRIASHLDKDSENAIYVKRGKAVYALRKDFVVPLTPEERREGIKAFIVVPLLDEEKVVGCMNLGSHVEREPPYNASIWVATVAAEVGSAVSRLEARAALRESEARYRQIFDIAPAGIYDVDFRTGKLVEVNDAICEYSGYTKGELLSMNAVDLLAEESQKRFINRISKMLSGASVPDTVDYEVIKKDGSLIWGSFSNRYVYEGENIAGATVVVRIITERKRAEEALKIKSKNLEEINTALNVLLKKRRNDKTDLEERFLGNIKQMVLPYLDKIESGNRDPNRKVLIDILRENLSEVTSSFAHNLSFKYFGLSPAETRVANLIKNGKNTKAIAGILNISPKTVKNHRQKIREKIGIINKKVNLRSYLLSLI